MYPIPVRLSRGYIDDNHIMHEAMSILETTLKDAGFNEPFDRDAELSVLCMMLRSDQALGQAIDSLSKEMFYDIDCSSLFETISKIWNDNKEISAHKKSV